MKPLTCEAARHQLQAFHDRELTVAAEFSVASHLDTCSACASASAELAALSVRLRREAPARVSLVNDDVEGLTSAVISRFKAEEDASLFSTVRLMFDDMHLVYAECGAAVASLACVLVVLSLLRFGPDHRPDSLSAMVSFLATPGIGASQLIADEDVQMRWTERFRQANEAAEQDAVFALSAGVIGRHGVVDHLRLVRRRSPGDAVLIERLLDTVLRGRLTPDFEGVLPTSNMFRLVTQTTVRAAKAQPVDQTVPATPTVPKKHATAPTGRQRVPTAV